MILLSATLLSSCTIWPEPSERVLSLSDRRIDTPPELDHEYLTSLLEISKARLGYIVEGGAEFCIPGQVKKIKRELLLARQEIDGNLLLDAQFSIARSIEQLDYSVQLMKGISETTGCISAFSRDEVDSDQDYRRINELASVLNCDCERLDAEGVITSSFEKRLITISAILDIHPEMTLNIYSNRDDQALGEMVAFLKSRGIRYEQILGSKTDDYSLISGSDKLGFEFQLSTENKNLEVKGWRDSIIIKSSIIRR